MSGETSSWPTCPICGEKVAVSGQGVKSCGSCGWEYRPPERNRKRETTQTGLGDYE